MIEAIATVIACENGMLTLEASQQSSCDQCTQQECGNGQVNKSLSRRYHQLTLPYDTPLELGTKVVLALPERGLLSAAGLMFVLPLISLLLFASIGQWLFVTLLQQHELWVICSALLGAWLGFWLGRLWHRKLKLPRFFEPFVVKVLDSCSELDQLQFK